MRNDELFSPVCPDIYAKRLVNGYVLRGLADKRGTYWSGVLLAKQHAVYEEWLSEMRKHDTSFVCGFYEWLGRDCDAAFIFKPGDLVMCSDRYYVVVQRLTNEVVWENCWRLRNGTFAREPWPSSMCNVELKDSAGQVSSVDVLCGSIEPADIPTEVFTLACARAKDCPIMKGGAE